MAKLDIKIIVILATIMLVMLTDDSDAGRRGSSTSRRRTTYRSTRTTSTSSSSGLVIGLSIFGGIVGLVIIFVLIGYCCNSDSHVNPETVVSQPQAAAVQYQNNKENQPPPYTENNSPCPTKNAPYPPPGEGITHPKRPPEAMLYPPMFNPGDLPACSPPGYTDATYTSPGDTSAAYPPPGITNPTYAQPPVGNKGQAGTNGSTT